MGENGHTMLEREVADIIISLLHRQGFDSRRRFRRRVPRPVPSYFCFPRWGVKRKRSVLSPAHARSAHGSGDCGKPLSISSSNAPSPSSPSSNCGEPTFPQKSPEISFADKEPQAVAPVSGHRCPNVMEARFSMNILERGSLFWPGQSSGSGGKKFVLPDLNMSVEELVAVAADAELRQRQHLVAVAADTELRQRQRELYETACRRLAAADARRRRRELQKLKNSIAAGSPLCSSVR